MLVTYVGSICDVHQIAEFWWVDFLVLGGQHEAGHADELQLGSAHSLALQVPVNKVDCEIERLMNHLEFEVNLNEPVNQDGSHLLIDVFLLGHVCRGHTIAIPRLTLGCS